jgi:hypothetical protein
MDGTAINAVGEAPAAPEIHVAFWNLQNLFDPETSTIAAEPDHAPVTGWDRRAFEIRVRLLADIIRQMCDGRSPDLLGLCEVENERVARRLMQEIGRSDYQLAHVEQPHIRGLDTTLIYSDRVFELDRVRTCGHLVHQRLRTRDIFEVQLRVRSNGADLRVLVNHWPSRHAGQPEAEAWRVAVASHCRQLVHDHLKLSRKEYLELDDNDLSLFLLHQRWNRNLLIMGDLNDEPWDRSVKEVLGADYSLEQMDEIPQMVRGTLPSWKAYSGRPVGLFNPMWSLLATPDQGTCSSDGNTRPLLLHDQLIVSRGLALGLQGLKLQERSPGVPDVRIVRPTVMTTCRGRPREFRGDDHTGYSSHFPITATLQATGQ